MVCSAGRVGRSEWGWAMREELKYWVALSKVSGIGPARFAGLMEHFGDAERAWTASKPELQATGLPANPLNALLTLRKTLDLEQLLERISASGYRVLTWDDQDYPDRLREIPAPPPVVYLWGELAPVDRWAVAVVGTRRMSAYGRSVAEDLSRELAAHGITVVSGLARGIDGTAHRASLDAGGRTLAVLGSGLDVMYPPEHRGLAEEIAASGAVLSDYSLGTEPEPGNFPPRNRIISGLSLAVVVVEAGANSGALITANFAAEHGRDVFAVPGNINVPTSEGANRLIRDGAHPLLDAQDVLEALNLELAVRQEVVQQALPEDPTERRLLETLSKEPTHIDELGARVGLSSSEIAASLALLELKGHVRQVGGMKYVLARERGPDYTVD